MKWEKENSSITNCLFQWRLGKLFRNLDKLSAISITCLAFSDIHVLGWIFFKASRRRVYTISPSSPCLQAEGEQKCTSSASHIPESWRRASMGSASRSCQGGTGAPGFPNMDWPSSVWTAHLSSTWYNTADRNGEVLLPSVLNSFWWVVIVFFNAEECGISLRSVNLFDLRFPPPASPPPGRWIRLVLFTGPVPGNNVSLTSWRRSPQRRQPMSSLLGAHVI